MTPKEFLYQLNPNSKVFDLSVDYRYTEYQMLLFAKLYHESELKKLRVTDVSRQSEQLKCTHEPVSVKGKYTNCKHCPTILQLKP